MTPKQWHVFRWFQVRRSRAVPLPDMTGGASVTAEEFRSIAVSLPEALEDEHMGHLDFRVRGKIFATLGPEERWDMVKLTPAQQAVFV